MSTTRVLVLGGHGKVSLFLQPLLLAKKWDVTSVVRTAEQEAEILALGKDKPGKIEVLVDSLDDVKEVSHATRVLEKVRPDIVVWSAGAGGKGGPARTKAIDEVAAKAYISASLATPSVKKFLLVSYIAVSCCIIHIFYNPTDTHTRTHCQLRYNYADIALAVTQGLPTLVGRRGQEGGG
jgi:nucleoside-diphosphate-sugar epimerase